MTQMKNKFILVLLQTFVIFFSCSSQTINTITFDNENLLRLKDALKYDLKIQTSKNELIKKCNGILNRSKTYSVTYNISAYPFAKSNDYTSRSRYWWPNPKTRDGLPYILIDGKVNRYSEKVSDKPMIDGLANDVIHLGVAYFYTKDESYVKWAAKLLDCFFVNNDTKMNPNFNFSQVVPGQDDSGGSIMESVVLINVIEGIQLMKSSPNFPQKLKTELNRWFLQYLNWLNSDPVGKKNARYTNNRGTYYTLLRCAIALYVDNVDLSRDIFKNEAFKRVDEQISKEGIMSKEISRTLPLGYVKYNLSGFLQLNEIGKKLGFDLLNYRGANGQSLKNALAWLNSFRDQSNVWKYSTERGITTPRLLSMKGEDETKVKFTVERFDDCLETLTTINE